MKSSLVLALATSALALSACESMYVGGSVGTLADSGYRPRFLPASENSSKKGSVCGDKDCVAAVRAK